MTLPAVKTFTAGDVLSYADLNAINFNILHNPIKLVTPLTGALAVGNNDFTSPDELWFDDAAANTTAAGRLRRNAATLVWQPVASANVAVRGGMDRDVTSIEVVNTTTLTTVYTFTLPGNTFTTSNRLRVSLIGDYLNNSGSSATLEVRVTVNVHPDGHISCLQTLATGATRRGIFFTAEVGMMNDLTIIVFRGRCVYGAVGTSTGTGAIATAIRHATNFDPAAGDLTVDGTFHIQVQHGTANANISFIARVVHLELIP